MTGSLLCVLALIAGAGPLSAEGQTYDLTWQPLAVPYLVYLHSVEWSQTPPEDAGEMPRFTSPRPWYGEFTLGDSPPLLVAIDITGEAGQAPSCTIYVDVKRNRQLSGETPLRAASEQVEFWGRLLVTPEIVVPVIYRLPDGVEVRQNYPLRLAFRGGVQPTAAPRPFMLLGRTRQGLIRLGDSEVLIGIGDGAGDARVGGRHDRLWLDRDGDGELGRSEAQPATRYVEWEGGFYELAFRPDGAQVTVTPYRGELATLELNATDGRGRPTGVAELWLHSEGREAPPGVAELRLPRDYLFMRVEEPGTHVQALPGEYWVHVIVRGADGERTYRFVSGHRGVALAAGQVTELACGGSLEPTITMREWQDHEGRLLMASIHATTASGLHFQGPTRRLPDDGPAGKVTVLDAAGAIVGAADAEYG